MERKRNLTFRESLSITSMLFGMFFGAGNLIFPAKMGQQAGSSLWLAMAGMFITGVGLPLLGVAALGISRSDGLQSLSSRVGKRYGYFFTCLLYLTIGPFFAIPRCANVPFTVGVAPLLAPEASHTLPLAIFTLVFFAAVLFFSLRPSRIMTWIGNILNPIFLVLLGVLVVRALISPLGAVQDMAPLGGYKDKSPFLAGFLEGYGTMDALAGLAFGIVVVEVIRRQGVNEPGDVARNTVFSGIFSCVLMGVIYLFISIVCAQSRALHPEECKNGGEMLALVANHYFGQGGALMLAAIITLACLKTAVGLITSCSETFSHMFPKGPGYTVWAVSLSLFALLVSNLGLDAIIAYSVPMLMFLYPLAITLVLLALLGRFFRNDRAVYAWVTAFTLPAAVLDFVAELPENAMALLHVQGVLDGVKRWLPLFDMGLGWVCPAAIGLVVGLAVSCKRRHDRRLPDKAKIGA